MKKIKIDLRGKSPSSFLSSKAVSNVEESLDYIPGSTFRGALANEYLSTDGIDNTFKKIFTDGLISFCNLYIEGARPVSLSALSCKYHPGFLNDSDTARNDLKHGVVDALLPLIKEICNDQTPKYQECASCSAPMKKYRKYYYDFNKTVNVSKRLTYHTAISAVAETASESNIYSQEVIEEDQIFQGEILVHDNSLAEEIINLLKRREYIFLGSDKSRGLGRFKMEYSGPIDNDDEYEFSELKTRVDDFNTKLGLKDGKTYFSITLQSDAVLTDNFMRHKATIEPEDIGIEDSITALCISDNRIVSGWNSLLKLPKDDDIAIIKGSVFVYNIDHLDESIIKTLCKFENEGIGKRRSEGFGRLTVCDPFHFRGGEVK